jgi:hypothetical protein
MRPPSERADDVAEAPHRQKRGIERRAANRIVDHVKAAAVSVFCDIFLDARLIIVDRNGAQLFDEGHASGRACREHLRAEGACELNGDMADAAGSAMDQHFLARLQVLLDQPGLPMR